jgi:hypothetical protein
MEELAKRFAELAERVGPSAMDAARGAVKIEALSAMVGGGMLVLVSAVLITAARVLWGYKTRDSFNEGVPRVIAGIIFAVALITSCCAIWAFIDPWTWTAINNPDLYLAKKILKL